MKNKPAPLQLQLQENIFWYSSGPDS